jgi:hypothetical protein
VKKINTIKQKRVCFAFEKFRKFHTFFFLKKNRVMSKAHWSFFSSKKMNEFLFFKEIQSKKIEKNS